MVALQEGASVVYRMTLLEEIVDTYVIYSDEYANKAILNKLDGVE